MVIQKNVKIMYVAINVQENTCLVAIQVTSTANIANLTSMVQIIRNVLDICLNV